MVLGTVTPAFAISDQARNLNTVYSYLSQNAARHGLMTTNATHDAHPRSGPAAQSSTTSLSDALKAIHSMPKASQFARAEFTPDPTAEEMPFVLPGATDGDGLAVTEPIEGLLFGTLNTYEEEITGIFDDLTQLPEEDATAYDSSVIDPSLMDPELDPYIQALITPSISDPVIASLASGGTQANVLQLAALTSPTAIAAVGAPTVMTTEETTDSANQDQAKSTTFLQGYISTTDGAPEDLSVFKTSDDCVWAPADAQRTIDLKNGEVLLEAGAETHVQTANATVCIPRGCIALVRTDKDVTTVRFCAGIKRVSLVTDGPAVKLNAGEEATIASSGVSLKKGLADGIAKRHIQRSAHSNIHIAVSEFSVEHLLSTNEQLKALRHSGTSRDVKAFYKVLKAAAVLHTVTRSHGRYYFAKEERLPARAFLH